MKKTLIASAVVASFSTSAIAMDNSHAEKILGMVEGMPTVYGDIEIFGTYTDIDNTPDNTDGITDDVDSTIGFSHSTAISEETTASATVEFIYNSTMSGSTPGVDQAYITFEGGFGSVSLGTIDSVYEDLDIIDFSENLGVLSAGDLVDNGDSQNINYVSPKIGDSLTVKATVQTDEDSGDDAQIVLAYEADNLAVNVGYGMKGTDGVEDVIGLSAAYSMDDLTITAQYEMQDDAATESFAGLLGTYAMGANTFNLGYFQSSSSTAGVDDTTAFAASVVHNLADNVYIYAEAGFQSDPDVTNYVIGTAYSF